MNNELTTGATPKAGCNKLKESVIWIQQSVIWIFTIPQC